MTPMSGYNDLLSPVSPLQELSTIPSASDVVIRNFPSHGDDVSRFPSSNHPNFTYSSPPYSSSSSQGTSFPTSGTTPAMRRLDRHYANHGSHSLSRGRLPQEPLHTETPHLYHQWQAQPFPYRYGPPLDGSGPSHFRSSYTPQLITAPPEGAFQPRSAHLTAPLAPNPPPWIPPSDFSRMGYISTMEMGSGMDQFYAEQRINSDPNAYPFPPFPPEQ